MGLIRRKIQETIDNLNKLLNDEGLVKIISEVAELIADSIRAGNKLMICGNGGSAADAQHIAGEFLCRFYKDREPMAAVALSTDTSILTSISNDYSYNEVFSRQVRGLGRSGDILLGISTSGSSANILQAFRAARAVDIKTILLTGGTEREIAAVSDVVIKAPSTDTPRIQEMHLLIEHIICEIVERDING